MAIDSDESMGVGAEGAERSEGKPSGMDIALHAIFAEFAGLGGDILLRRTTRGCIVVRSRGALRMRALAVAVLLAVGSGCSGGGSGTDSDGAAGSGGSRGGAGGSTNTGGSTSAGGGPGSGGSPGTGGAATGGGPGTGGAASGGSPGTGGAATGGGPGTGGSAGMGTGGTAGMGPTSLACPPLAPATRTTVSVTPAEAGNLDQIVANAASGTTIELADGHYDIGRLNFNTPNVTLRSASNDATKVILDGNYNVGETIFITASNVTIAHVTVQRATFHPIHITTPTGGPDVTGSLIYGARIIDGAQQFVKINPNADRASWVDDGRVECSEFSMTPAGRARVDSCCGGCYTGGIDAHDARGWVVRNNRFEDIYCDGAGLAEHAVHFWKSSRDTLVENNVIINCARGIGFGLSGGVGDRVYSDNPHGGVALAHVDGVIRNNFIFASVPWYDTGIELHIAREPQVYHNTVISTMSATAFFSSIDWRFGETRAVITNNLVRRLTERDGAQATLTTNLPNSTGGSAVPMSYFVDPAAGDFHLTSSATGAIDQGTVIASSGIDLDGDTHDIGSGPDLGCDEYTP